ncbi:unnamed protein product [Rhizophagus irregularis]|nr:unnamed protein product [Rhizophagus irregularis]
MDFLDLVRAATSPVWKPYKKRKHKAVFTNILLVSIIRVRVLKRKKDKCKQYAKFVLQFSKRDSDTRDEL